MPNLLTSVINKVLAVRDGYRAWRFADGNHDRPRVCYGFDHVPEPDEQAWGGIVKFQKLQPYFPNSPRAYNILYMVSSYALPQACDMARMARKAGAKVVWSQDGVAYPAWHGPGWERTNAPMKAMVHEADHVFYQSEFCKRSADLHLGEREGPSEILYNAVDIEEFRPASSDPDPSRLVLLLSGSHWETYRVRTALATLSLLLGQRKKVRLIVAGRLCWEPTKRTAEKDFDVMCEELGVKEHVTFRGPYTQAEAVDLMQSTHIVLHTKCNDPCPGLILEALACGLPVVYSDSGGTPELVGQDAGIGVKSDVSWESFTPPDPADLAEAVLRVDADRQKFSQAARDRAESMFDFRKWLARHRELFDAFMK